MNIMRTGLGKAVDQLVAALAEEFADQGAFKRVTVIDIGHGETIVRGLNNSNRLDGYGLTKQMVMLARAELRRIGYAKTFEEIDGMLHHAEQHRSEMCECRKGHFRRSKAISGAKRQKRMRTRRFVADQCVRCGKEPQTNGTICAVCVEYLRVAKREQRARAKSPDFTPMEIDY